MKEQVLFESKEYGIGGHSKLELRRMDNGELRLWTRDGKTNALICMDRSDVTKLIAQLKKHVDKAPEEVESFDFTKPISRKKVATTSSVTIKKARKPRSDKGKKRGPRKKMVTTGTFDELKAQRIEEAMG